MFGLLNVGSSQRRHSYETPNQPSLVNSKGHHRGRLNNLEQTKQISKLEFKDLPKSKNGLFLAKVSFRLTATGEMLSFPSSAEKSTSRDAQEEAARVACKHLGELSSVAVTKLMIFDLLYIV